MIWNTTASSETNPVCRNERKALSRDRAAKEVLQRLEKGSEIIGGREFLGGGVHMGPVPLASRANKVVTGVEKVGSRGSVGIRIAV